MDLPVVTNSESAKCAALSFKDPARALEFVWKAIVEGLMPSQDGFALAGDESLVESGNASSSASLASLLERSVEVRAPRVDDVLAPLILAHADALSYGGKPSDALPLYDAGVVFFNRSESTLAAATCRVYRAVALSHLQRWEEAAGEYATADAKLEPGSLDLARCRKWRADALTAIGRHDDALAAYESARSIFDTLGCCYDAGLCLQRGGNVLSIIGRDGEAVTNYERAEGLFKQLDRVKECATVQMGRATMLRRLKQWPESVTLYAKAAEMFSACGEALQQAQCRMACAEILYTTGRLVEALAAYEAVEPAFRAINRPIEAGLCHLHCGHLLARESGRESDAVAAYKTAREFFAAAPYPLGLGRARLYEGNLQLRLGKAIEALEAFEQAEAVLHAHDATSYAACLEGRGRAFVVLKRLHEAKGAYEGARLQYENHGSAEQLARCDRRLAATLFSLGDYTASAARYREAANVYVSVGLHVDAAHCFGRLGDALDHLGQFAESVDAYRAAQSEFTTASRPLEAAECIRERAVTLRNVEQFTSALNACDDAAEAYERCGAVAEVARCHLERAKILRTVGRIREALTTLDGAIATFEQHGLTVQALSARVTRSDVLLGLGRSDEALAEAEVGVTGLLALDDRAELAEARRQYGIVLAQLGRSKEGIAFLELAEADFKAQGMERDLADCQMGRALLWMDLGRHEEALATCEAAEVIFAARGQLPSLARCRSSRALILQKLGRYAEAVAAAECAEEVFAGLGLDAEAATWRLFSAGLYLALSRPEEALAACESSLPSLRRLGRLDQVAFGTMQAASALEKLGRHDEALQATDEAIKHFTSLGRPSQVTGCLLIRATVLDSLGRVEDALRDYEEAERGCEAAGMIAARAACQMDRAYTLFSAGRPRRAIEVYGRIDKKLLNDDALLRYHHGFGKAYLQAGLHERGLEQLTHARLALRRARRIGGIDETNLLFVSEREEMVHAATHHALALGRFELAFDALQDAKAGVFGDLHRRPRRDPIREPEGTRAARANLTEWLRLSHEHERDDSPYWEEAMHRSQAYLRAWRQSVVAPAVPGPELDDAVILRDVQKAIPEKWALIDFWRSGEEEFQAFIVTRQGLSVERLYLPLSDAGFLAKFKAFEEAIAAVVPGSDEVLDDLYRHLFDPLRAKLEGLVGLYLVPHGFLHAVPLHAARRTDGGRAVYLSDTVAVAYLPSAALLPQLPPLRRSGPVLSLANPERGTDLSLPFADWESSELQRRLAGRVRGEFYTGADARLARTEGWGEASLVHFSCHGLGEEGMGALSRLRLADDLLLAHDVVYRRTPLAEGALVVLSGCETAVRDWRAVDEAMGLMSAFLMRGAGLVLATQWSVEDASAAELVVSFVSEVLAGGAPHTAFRHAQHQARALTIGQVQARERELLRAIGKSDPKGTDKVHRRAALRDMRRHTAIRTGDYDHPVYWAAFQLVGRVT